MPKVLHLIDHNGLGGAQRIVHGILQARKSDLVYPLRLDTKAMFPAPAGSYSPIQRTNLGWVGALPKIAALVKENRIEILHCHLQASWITGIFLSKLRRVSPKVHFVFHEHNPYILHSKIYRSLVIQAEKIGSILVVSEPLYRATLDIGVSPQRVKVLENFVDLEYFQSKSSANLTPLDIIQASKTREMAPPSGTEKTLYAGFAGRLVTLKGWKVLLKLAQELSNTPIKLLVAGEGPDATRFRWNIRRHGLEDKILLVGFIGDMRRFYRTIAVLAFPSLFEPFGLVPLEAQACGVPVVAFETPGIRERFNPASTVLIPPGDIHQFASSIQQVIDNPALRSSLVQNGYQNVLRFTLANYLQGLENFYQEVLEKSNP